MAANASVVIPLLTKEMATSSCASRAERNHRPLHRIRRFRARQRPQDSDFLGFPCFHALLSSRPRREVFGENQAPFSARGSRRLPRGSHRVSACRVAEYDYHLVAGMGSSCLCLHLHSAEELRVQTCAHVNDEQLSEHFFASRHGHAMSQGRASTDVGDDPAAEVMSCPACIFFQSALQQVKTVAKPKPAEKKKRKSTDGLQGLQDMVSKMKGNGNDDDSESEVEEDVIGSGGGSDTESGEEEEDAAGNGQSHHQARSSGVRKSVTSLRRQRAGAQA